MTFYIYIFLLLHCFAGTSESQNIPAAAVSAIFSFSCTLLTECLKKKVYTFEYSAK